MNNKFFITSAFVALIVTSPFTASALSVADLQAQIQSLLAKIAALQAQIRVVEQEPQKSVQGTTISAHIPRICGILNRNLAPGANGDDVRGLQEFLSGEGFLSAQATGYFGPMTAQAVAKWQTKEGVQSIGSVGPLTRERLKVRCGNTANTPNPYGFRVAPQAGNAPLTITAYANVGGYSLYRYFVDFGDGSGREAIWCNAPADACVSPGSVQHTYTKDGTYTVALYQTHPGGCGMNADPRCLGMPAQEVVLAKESVRVGSGPVACTKEYMPVCGAKPIVCITTPCNPIPTTYGNQCEMRADGASYLYGGECRDTSYDPEQDRTCKAWNDGCNACSRSAPGNPGTCTQRACLVGLIANCTAYFDDTKPNGAPVISSFSGPVSLGVNEVGTWKISASDPENGRLTYAMVWGDEWVRLDAALSSSAAPSIVQQSSFTHSYANPGSYTVALTVTDDQGKQARATATASVSQTLCTRSDMPVCGRPQGCVDSCPPGMLCAMMCRLHEPVSYANRCEMNNANATLIHAGVCTGSETY